ncbi:MAG TPA: hypothetical protein ENN90_11265 [Mariniphaga anaerophila]|uniref:Thiamine pyrophosphate enzyme, N-terminal TPP binding domain n=1 Tax=Mariniphaga anaerophila TaxID=1484053 RepID=A0A831PQZ2_9BACT|nr:hypothetical protein [Mariniphaga anaerophila]
MLTVAQEFARTLRDLGIRHVFGVPSGNMIDYIEAITSSNHYFGVPIFRVNRFRSYQKVLAGAFSAKRPVIVEAVVNGSEYDELLLRPNK